MALMAVSDESPASFHHHQIHRFPQNQYIDSLRWLPQLSPSLRHILLSTTSGAASTLQSFSLSSSSLTPLSSLPLPSRLTSLKASHHSPRSLIAASTLSGDLLLLSSDLSSDASLSLQAQKGVHKGPVSGMDLSVGSSMGMECVSVGEDGRVNVVSVGEGVESRRVFDSQGLVEYTTVKWASPTEFVTGGLGFGLQWWDLRRPGAPVSQFKGNW